MNGVEIRVSPAQRYCGVRSIHYTQSCGGFSLAPSEGERAGGEGLLGVVYPAVLAVSSVFWKDG